MVRVEQVCPLVSGTTLVYQNLSRHSLMGKDHKSMKGDTSMETRVKAQEVRVGYVRCLRQTTVQGLMNKTNTSRNTILTIPSSSFVVESRG
jgi:hypothetical protein